MTQHTALADLPAVLEEMGLNVIVADDWLDGQGNYLWTDPHTGQGSYDGTPSAYMVHHTAGSSATPPDHSDSKANAWIGLERDGRLYQEGGGTPTIYLATSGPCRVSSGYGYRPAAWDYTFEGRRAPVNAEGPDGDTALNRYAFNAEVVHEGDGSALDPGVWDHVVGLGIALESMLGLKEMTLAHRSWTGRKIDPYWSVGKPHDGTSCIIDIQDAIAEGIKDPSDPGCPWTEGNSGYGPCSMHYNKDEWGDDSTGICNAPSWAYEALDWGVDVGMIRVRDTSRDDFDRNLTDGRYWVFQHRLLEGYIS